MGGTTGRARDGFDHRRFVAGLGRGVGGALLFALPMFLTMEMWALGFYMDRFRLLVLLVVTIPLLIVLSDRIGFEKTAGWREALRDASIAYAIGILSSAIVLAIAGILVPGDHPDATLGKIALSSVPASIGALLGRSQLDAGDGGDDSDGQGDGQGDGGVRETRYGEELFMMAVGALFLALNVAPTEEMILVSYKMSFWHALAMMALSIVLMHGFVYAVSFKGSPSIGDGTPGWHAFIRFTLPGYVIATLISLYCLWTFERLGGVAPTQVLMSVAILNLPGAIGAASARLIL
ncbi:TIGR02587 family membrane protein [Ensifer soli]|uniref:TIGR02587 family membrane protein n=1 Tax=Ciceribacter sp. sgz301302 TaxID=3342379 RepID=UPI0035B80A0D